MGAAIHARYTKAEIARFLASPEELRADTELARFVAWVRTKPDDFYDPTQRARGKIVSGGETDEPARCSAGSISLKAAYYLLNTNGTALLKVVIIKFRFGASDVTFEADCVEKAVIAPRYRKQCDFGMTKLLTYLVIFVAIQAHEG